MKLEKRNISIAGEGREASMRISVFELDFKGWSGVGRLLGS